MIERERETSLEHGQSLPSLVLPTASNRPFLSRKACRTCSHLQPSSLLHQSPKHMDFEDQHSKTRSKHKSGYGNLKAGVLQWVWVTSAFYVFLASKMQSKMIKSSTDVVLWMFYGGLSFGPLALWCFMLYEFYFLCFVCFVCFAFILFRSSPCHILRRGMRSWNWKLCRYALRRGRIFAEPVDMKFEAELQVIVGFALHSEA